MSWPLLRPIICVPGDGGADARDLAERDDDLSKATTVTVAAIEGAMPLLVEAHEIAPFCNTAVSLCSPLPKGEIVRFAPIMLKTL